MFIVDKHCSDVCHDEFSVPQIDHKSKQVKELSETQCSSAILATLIDTDNNILLWMCSVLTTAFAK